jgi:hypothetical protein
LGKGCTGCGEWPEPGRVVELGVAVETAGPAEVEALVEAVEREPGVHPHHWLRLRANIRFCDLMKVELLYALSQQEHVFRSARMKPC